MCVIVDRRSLRRNKSGVRRPRFANTPGHDQKLHSHRKQRSRLPADHIGPHGRTVGAGCTSQRAAVRDGRPGQAAADVGRHVAQHLVEQRYRGESVSRSFHIISRRTSSYYRLSFFATQEQAQSVAFSSDGVVVTVGCVSGRWLVFEAQTRELLALFTDGSEPIQVIKYSPNGNMVAIGSRDNYIYIYQVSDASARYSKVGRCVVRVTFCTTTNFSFEYLRKFISAGDVFVDFSLFLGTF